MAEGRAVKVERSRARGRVVSNTLTARPAAIRWACAFCLEPHALPNKLTQLTTKTPLIGVRFFEASAHLIGNGNGKG
jgi:hypothetical protein